MGLERVPTLKSVQNMIDCVATPNHQLQVVVGLIHAVISGAFDVASEVSRNPLESGPNLRDLILGDGTALKVDAIALVQEVHERSCTGPPHRCQGGNLALMATNLNVFVGYRGDRLTDEARVAQTPDDLSRLNQRVQQGNGILKAWAEGHGGRSLAQMGDGGRLEIGADHLHELPQICSQYEQEVGTTLSVGVGKKLAECEQALEFAVKTGGGVHLWTEELARELASLSQGGAAVKIYDSYLNKAEPALNKPAAGGGMTGPSQPQATAPTEPTPEGSEHSENEALQGMLEDAGPPPADLAGQFTQLAEQSEGAEQQQKEQQAAEQQQAEDSDNVRQAIVDILKQFKEQAPLWEQLKEAQPEAYKTLTGVIQAMIALAKQVYAGDGEEQKEEPAKKSEQPLHPMHTTVEGFMTQLKTMPKVGPERGKFITSHMNHGPFLATLQAHPQGKQIHGVLTQFLNSKANAGIGVGAHAVAKAVNFAHVINHLKQYDNSGDPDWIKQISSIVSKHPKWELRDLPFDSFDSGEARNEDVVEEYANLPVSTQPAIVVAPSASGLWTVDGGHRAQAAQRRGDKTIKAYVPVAKKDLMPGGKGDNKPDSKFDAKQLKTGQSQESEEHGLDPQRAKEIAKDHLTEDPKYYKKALPAGAKLNVKNPGDQTANNENREGFPGSAPHQVMEDQLGGPEAVQFPISDENDRKADWYENHPLNDRDLHHKLGAVRYQNAQENGRQLYMRSVSENNGIHNPLNEQEFFDDIENSINLQAALQAARSPILKRKVAKAGLSMTTHHALQAGKTGRHQVVLPVGSQIDGAPDANHSSGRLKVADPETGKSKWRSVRAGIVMAPDGTPTSSRNPSGGK